MIIIHVLGSGSGLPTARRDTTSLLVHGPDGHTLVECPGGLAHKLARNGVGVDGLRRIVLTHDHVDHIYGLPHLIHALLIHGSARELEIYGPAPAIATAQALIRAHGLDREGSPALRWHRVPQRAGAAVASGGGMSIWASPASHARETIALRFETARGCFTHSADSAISAEVVELARGADLLIHDCGGLHQHTVAAGSPHASARDAGEVAARAGVAALRLIHLGREAEQDEAALVREAEEAFGGSVEVAYDGAIYRVPTASPTAAPR